MALLSLCSAFTFSLALLSFLQLPSHLLFSTGRRSRILLVDGFDFLQQKT